MSRAGTEPHEVALWRHGAQQLAFVLASIMSFGVPARGVAAPPEASASYRLVLAASASSGVVAPRVRVAPGDAQEPQEGDVSREEQAGPWPDEPSPAGNSRAKSRQALPRISSALPRLAGDLPRLKGPLPRLRKRLPRITQHLPRLNTEIPRLQQELPRFSNRLPKLKGQLPWLESSLPLLGD